MDKSDWAIIIAGISAFGSFLSALFTGRMARNDARKMRRKPPTLELQHGQCKSEFVDWDHPCIVIRNHEPVGVNIFGIRTKRRSAYINSRNDATDSVPDGFGGKLLKSSLEKKRETRLKMRLNPRGTESVPRSFQPGDTAYVWAYTINVRKSTDLTLSWEWADGQK
ncbi:hypothetical protein [Marinovum algicola]|uniref:hypothetical protein n=1 Tax=Marinovum algicola TaxID=42444 RepID=UPI00352B4BFF